MGDYFDAHFAEILYGALTTAISILFGWLLKVSRDEIKYLRKELDECQDRERSNTK